MRASETEDERWERELSVREWLSGQATIRSAAGHFSWSFQLEHCDAELRHIGEGASSFVFASKWQGVRLTP